ncbi:MFS transporter [Bacillus sp. AGMB 02131]|uniref:MFS transporter n=1 Tax=Peribacillus faecalis TaxID=2772559 RepID=A0A927CTN3_9BACI|nr:MFS transporter [Peribacillus faecalis]MBD3107642.1 MFS transporter [Peribacillus faecalis]
MILKKILGDVPLTRDLILLIVIGGLYSLSVALSNTFVNIYLWKQSGSFYDIGFYNLVVVVFQPITFILAGKMAKMFDRVIVLRLGIVFLTSFYLTVLFVKGSASDHLFLLGAILGIGYGFYWLAFNVLTFEITEPENRDFFNGFLGIMSSIGGMVGPFLAGYIITHMFGNKGYTVIFSISMVFFALAVVLSLFIKRRPAHGKFHFIRIIKERKLNDAWRKITLAHVCQGWREGTFFFIVSVFVFISTGSELSIGSYGLINSGIGFIVYFIASRFIKKEYRNRFILIGGCGLFISIFLLIFHVSFFNLMLYGASIAVFYPLLLIPYISLTYDVIGRGWKAAEMRIEYVVVRELYLNAGRAMSIVVFLLSISLFNIETVMPYIIVVLGSGHLLIYFFVKDIQLGL